MFVANEKQKLTWISWIQYDPDDPDDPATRPPERISGAATFGHCCLPWSLQRGLCSARTVKNVVNCLAVCIAWA